MSYRLIFRNMTYDRQFVSVFFTCPIPNNFRSLHWQVQQCVPNAQTFFEWNQNQLSFVWAPYDAKKQGIFTQDNQLDCRPRYSNLVTFTSEGGAHFTDHKSAPNNEMDIKIAGSVRTNLYYGGLCMFRFPMYAQKMEPNTQQRYPTEMNMCVAYSTDEIVQGAIINSLAVKIVELKDYQGAAEVMVILDNEGNVTVETK